MTAMKVSKGKKELMHAIARSAGRKVWATNLAAWHLPREGREVMQGERRKGLYLFRALR